VNNFCFLPVDGTRGGILLAARATRFSLQNPSLTHTISAKVSDATASASCIVTRVYGPHGDLEKKIFIKDLINLKQAALPNWLMFRDFNLIYKIQDKSNDMLDHSRMLKFRRALDHLEMNEIDLLGRKFTWASSHQAPTMTRIDRAFATASWEEYYAHPIV
jgi:hypothetical protein